jgi:serine/threonine-protein kinase
MIAGKYVLDRLLGQGGMGAVFAARHLKLSKAVAIKIMLADTSNPEAAQRFINEGRAAANIQNEHVVRVDDVDEEMGYAYMVLELLEGKDLAQLLEADPAKRLAPHIAVNYVLQGLRGVAQAHAIGIVHRDLKPSNLFLAKRKDGSDVVKVLDFGISKATNSSALGAAPNALTSTKAMLGSPLYMSPEQLRNAKGVDHRADIWAMGVILYELMTGQLPFMGDNLGELFAAILETDPVPLQGRGCAAPPGLNEVVLRCLARKPEHRFQSAAELMQALAPYEQPGAAGHAALPPMAGTAHMPGGIQTGPQMPGMAMTPPRPVTGSQVNMPAMRISQGGGTPSQQQQGMPPGFNQTGGSGWQQGSSANAGANVDIPPAAIPKSKMIAIISVFTGVAAVSMCFGLYMVLKKPHEDPNANAHPPPSASILATPEPTTSTTTKAPDPPPTESAVTPPVSAAVVTPPAPGPAPLPTHHTTAPAAHPAVAPSPQPGPAPAPVPAPQPAPHNTTKPPNVETNR